MGRTQNNIHKPSRFFHLQHTDVDWDYKTDKQRHLGDRQIFWPRGKVFGGSSSINGMVYIRGHRLDYDHWNYLGNKGWSYEDVLPYFKKSEHNERGGDRFHGVNGPLNISDDPNPSHIILACLEAMKNAGYDGGQTWDFNGQRQENAAGLYQFTITRRRHNPDNSGQDCRSYSHFLVPKN